jgi:hypothetical protein
MVVYKKDGVVYVGHVGTVDDPHKQHSVKAKEAWNTFAENNQGNVLRGFNPARAWANSDSRPEQIHGDGVPRIWGLVTKSELISIYVYRLEKDRSRYRIADWKVVEPSYVPQLYQI